MAVGALSPDGLVRETPLIIILMCMVGALSQDGLVGETQLEIYEAVGACSLTMQKGW